MAKTTDAEVSAELIAELERKLVEKDAQIEAQRAQIESSLSDMGGTRASGVDKPAGKGPFWRFECECPKLAAQHNAVSREDKEKCGAIKVIKAGDESDAKRLFCIRTLHQGRSLNPSEWTVIVRGLDDKKRFDEAAKLKHKRMVDSGLWPENAKLPNIRRAVPA